LPGIEKAAKRGFFVAWILLQRLGCGAFVAVAWLRSLGCAGLVADCRPGAAGRDAT